MRVTGGPESASNDWRIISHTSAFPWNLLSFSLPSG